MKMEVYPLVNVNSLRTGTSPSLSSVNQRTKCAVFQFANCESLPEGNKLNPIPPIEDHP